METVEKLPTVPTATTATIEENYHPIIYTKYLTPSAAKRRTDVAVVESPSGAITDSRKGI
jgi:hypothetical protein